MSGVVILGYLLADDAALVAKVPLNRILGGVLPLKTAYPAISLRQVSGSEFQTLRRGENATVTERIQVSVLASTYREQKEVIESIRNAIQPTYGYVNGFFVDSVRMDIDSPDMYSEDPVTYEQSIDFMVKYTRS